MENVDSDGEDEEMTTAFDQKQDDREGQDQEEKVVNLERLNDTDDDGKEEAIETDAIPLTKMKQTDLEQQLSAEQEEKKLIQNETCNERAEDEFHLS